MGADCNNASKDYFLEIKINNKTQGDRRRLTLWNFLRKDTDETLNGTLTVENNINFNMVGNKMNLIDGRSNLRNISLGVFRFHHTPMISNTRVITFNIDSGGQENTSGIVMEYNENGSGSYLIRQYTENELYTWDEKGTLKIKDLFTRFIGSLTNRITKLFVQDIDFNGSISGTGNINTTGDLTANNVNASGAFYGNGHGLTNISVNGINNYYKYAESNEASSTSSISFQQKVRLNLTNIPAGDYLVSWNAQFSGDKKSTVFEIHIQEDDTTQTDLAQWVPFANNDGGAPKQSGSFQRTLTAGNHTFDLEYRSTNSGETASIQNARIMAWKVS